MNKEQGVAVREPGVAAKEPGAGSCLAAIGGLSLSRGTERVETNVATNAGGGLLRKDARHA